MKMIKLFLVLALAASAAGCASSSKFHEISKTTPTQTSLSEGYSILAYLMKDESRVDKIFWIKDASPASEKLIGDISETSKQTLAKLGELAPAKPAVSLKQRGLPRIEGQTRDAVSKTCASTLLGGSGPSFETYLLLTQFEATKYAAHLSQSLAASDPNPERRALMKSTSEKFFKLNSRVLAAIGK